LFAQVVPVDQALRSAPVGSSPIDNQIQNGDYSIPDSFFGIHINSTQTPWPIVQVGGQRLHSTNTNWNQIERSQGVYGFEFLDKWIAQAQKNNTPLIYTFDAVPQFYSSDPSDRMCNNGPGACHPPIDLNADGTGSDAAFKNFVTALVNHVGNKIQFWEIWNEPDQRVQWVPTDSSLPYSQLMRMAQDAREIILAANPNALMLTPPPVGYPHDAPAWMDGYLAAGGGAYADVIAFHGYVHHWKIGDYPVAENEITLVNSMKAVAAKYGQQDKPLWSTEGGWGNVSHTGFRNPVLQTAFTARFILLQESLGLARSFWYQWDNPHDTGKLWNGPDRNDLGMPGIAYQQVQSWTAGATLVTPCAPVPEKPSMWTCTYSRPGGYQAIAMWNTTGDVKVQVPEGYRSYRGLMGKSGPIGRTVVTGIWPILLENQ